MSAPVVRAGILISLFTLWAAAASAQSARETLSREALNAAAWAVAGLEQSAPVDIRRNLTFLREDLADESKSAPAAAVASYRAGTALCDALIAALDEHEQSAVRAGYRAAQGNATISVTSQALESRRNYKMNWPEYAREQSQRAEIARSENNRVAVWHEKGKVNWSDRAAALRRSLDDLYKNYRSALRQDPEFTSSGTVAPGTAALPSPPAAQPAAQPVAEPSGVVKNVPPDLENLFTREFAALSLEAQMSRITDKLKQLNAGYDGKIQYRMRKTGAEVFLSDLSIKNLWPVCAVPKLVKLHCNGSSVSDLTPLAGLSLTFLNCAKTQVSDITPLTGQSVRYLNCARTQVSDLSPVRSMPNLRYLVCDFSPRRDSAMLRSITTLETINGVPVAEFWKRVDAGENPPPEEPGE